MGRAFKWTTLYRSHSLTNAPQKRGVVQHSQQKRDTMWWATQMQVQCTDGRVNKIMASCKITALVSKQKTGLTQTLKQNNLIPRQNKLSKTWGLNGDVGDDSVIVLWVIGSFAFRRKRWHSFSKVLMSVKNFSRAFRSFKMKALCSFETTWTD
jgi:hypothetical protein